MLALITLLLGIIFGLFLAFLSLRLIKVNCPKCKKLNPLSKIMVFNFKDRTISGQPCPKCQQVKPQVDIY